LPFPPLEAIAMPQIALRIARLVMHPSHCFPFLALPHRNLKFAPQAASCPSSPRSASQKRGLVFGYLSFSISRAVRIPLGGSRVFINCRFYAEASCPRLATPPSLRQPYFSIVPSRTMQLLFSMWPLSIGFPARQPDSPRHGLDATFSRYSFSLLLRRDFSLLFPGTGIPIAYAPFREPDISPYATYAANLLGCVLLPSSSPPVILAHFLLTAVRFRLRER